MQNNIKKDYFWNTLGVLLQNAISPLLLVMITRVNGIYDSGLFSFAFSISIIFWAFGMWGGRTYQVSDVEREFSSRSYIVVRLILAVAMLAGAIFFSLINHYDLAKSIIVITLVLFKATESIADALYGVLQTHNHLYITGKSLTYKALLALVIFIIIDTVSRSILIGCIGIVVVNILFVIFYDIPWSNRLENIMIKFTDIWSYVKNAMVIMKRSAPVFGVLFLIMFPLNIPRYFLDIYHQEQIGYYGILVMPLTLVGLTTLFIMQPNIVNLSHLYDTKKILEFAKTVNKIIALIVLAGIFILLVSSVVGIQLLQLIFSVDFSGYWLGLVIIIIGAIAYAIVSVFLNIFIIMRRFKAQFYTLLLTSVALAIVSAVVVKRFGLLGGVVSFTAISVIQMIIFIGLYKVSIRKAVYAKEN